MNKNEIKLLQERAIFFFKLVWNRMTRKATIYCDHIKEENLIMYEDEVASHHFYEFLEEFNPNLFSSILKKIVQYFIKDETSISFKFSTAASYYSLIIEDKEDISKIIIEIRNWLREYYLANGIFDFPSGYLQGGYIFNNLWGIKVLQFIAETEEERNMVIRALNRLKDDWQIIDNNSFKGYYLELLIKAKDYLLDYQENAEHVVKEILQAYNENTGYWDNNIFYTAFILGNLLKAYNEGIGPLEKILHIVEHSLKKIFVLDEPNQQNFIEEFVKKIRGFYLNRNFFLPQTALENIMRYLISILRYFRVNDKFNNFHDALISSIIGDFPILIDSNREAVRMAIRYKNLANPIERRYGELIKKSTTITSTKPYDHNVFIMMPFRNDRFNLGEGDPRYTNIVNKIKETLSARGYKTIIAYENQLDQLLWNNVIIHMESCAFGIAIIGDFINGKYIFNNNVAIELGFMLSRGKDVLILKEKSMENVGADLSGTIIESIDMENPKELEPIIHNWIDSIEKINNNENKNEK